MKKFSDRFLSSFKFFLSSIKFYHPLTITMPLTTNQFSYFSFFNIRSVIWQWLFQPFVMFVHMSCCLENCLNILTSSQCQRQSSFLYCVDSFSERTVISTLPFPYLTHHFLEIKFVCFSSGRVSLRMAIDFVLTMLNLVKFSEFTTN